MTSAPAPLWHAAYPAPRTTEPGAVSKEDMLGMLQRNEEGFVLIDLRKVDHEGGAIRGSINLPAQSLYPTIPRLYKLFKSAGVKKAIWYCGSSGGRGVRAAGWFQDYINDQGDTEMESVILSGGIRGWATSSEEYTNWMEEYDEKVWQALKQGGCN